ncbi:MAG: hypothetical protein A2281_11175 [Bacteroidetes bacterium RIFOXYA12_FULL_38_20]|uniref:DUF3352 domain-containing protein n=1 Tax=Candidatus Uhrbacteria bacterium GW2011_GWF2_44_350 TaxID=1619000 RepID=A0A0G1JL11_9BACT|nr:MAG: hypothetical protein UW63_C0001G0005 [Candidatus Uhrbacteria bacterium GW2011_GWF2_44_350]OFY78677.1 MAG: hypothetical protein A2281_11175 [Bacteroidetes bacterium RIFOXYA12_FULL_38_20]
MSKKVVVIGITALIIGLLTAGYFFIRAKNIPVSPPINAVPNSAMLIVESNNLPGLLESLSDTNFIWKGIRDFSDFDDLAYQVKYLKQLFAGDPAVAAMTEGNTFMVSLHPTGKNKFGFLYLLGAGTKGNLDNITDWLNENINEQFNVTERENDGVTFYDAETTGTARYKKFTYAIYEGVVIFSFNSMLVEEAVDQAKSGEAITENPSFKKIAATRGKNVAANIYINYKLLPNLLNTLVVKEKSGLVQMLKTLSGWSVLDLNIKQDELMLYGFSAGDEKEKSWFKVMNGQTPAAFHIEEIIPNNSLFFMAMSVDKPEIYKKDLNDFRGGKNERLNTINARAGIDVGKIFYSILNNELGVIKTNFPMLTDKDNTFFVMNTKGTSMAEDELVKLLKSWAANENKSFEGIKSQYCVDKEMSFPVYNCPFENLPAILFGDVFGEAGSSWFAFYNNYVIFGNSKEAVSKFLYANVLQKVLYLDIDYRSYRESLSAKANAYVWVNLAIKPEFLSGYLDEKTYAAVKNNFSHINKFQALAMQFTADQDMIFSNIFLKFNPKVHWEEPKTVWESRLDTCVAIKPKLVINHESSEKEIFVQDMNNNIYLINSAGRIMWKKSLDERITSEVYQVDYYKNRKLQLLFSTRSKIYMLDRLGNPVEKYPVELRAPSTNGLALFDYDNNKDYRMFIACSDKKVYAMDKDGKLLKGWDFSGTDHNVYNPVQHFRIEDKDYIVFSDSLRTYVVDRKGEIRVNIKEYFPISPNNIFYLEQEPKTKKHRMVGSTSEGKIVYIDFEGAVTIAEMPARSRNHYFEFKDFDGDTYNDYIFVDKNKLEVYNYERSLLFTHQFEDEEILRPVLFIFPDNSRRMGIVSPMKEEIYLFEYSGEIYEGFPLRGATMFSISEIGKSTGKFNLLVGSKNSFLYNYAVQ